MANVLVVDDEKSIRVSLREFLKDAGHEVGVAEDADQAMGMLAAQDFDVVLADIILPRNTGVTLLKRIKETCPRVQVVLMTGEPTVETASEAVRADAFDYLAKPIGKEQLLKTVANAARVKDLDDALKRLGEENQRYRENLEHLVEVRTAEIRRLNQGLEREVAARTRDLVAANDNLTAFGYSVSHDLRAPLHRISGFASVVMERYRDVIDEHGQDLLRRMCRGVDEMNALISDLLALSRSTSGDLERLPIDLTDTVSGVFDKLAQSEPERSVAIEIQTGVEADGDPRFIQTVLENLIGNAWKYTAKTAQARIAFGRTESRGKSCLFVRDNGAGFDASSAKDLFRPFSRYHTAAEFEGSGIGLATAKRIVDRHGGEIWLDSQPGAGTTVYFTLDADQPAG